MKFEEYVELFEKFMEEEDYKSPTRTFYYTDAKKYYDKTGKTPVDFNTLDLYDFFKSFGALKMRTLIRRYDNIGRFYQYLVDKGVISLNPAIEPATDFVRRAYSEKEAQIPYYSRKDIENILNHHIPYSKEIYTSLILSYYEGVASSIQEIIDLKYSDLDYENLTMCGRPISKLLADAYKEMRSADAMLYESTRFPSRPYKAYQLDWIYPGSMFKTTGHNDVQIRSLLGRQLVKVSDSIGGRIDARILYNEGFVEYCRGVLGDDGVIQLVENQSRGAEYDKAVKQLIDGYGFRLPGHYKFREVVAPYVTAMKRRYNL